MSRLPNECQTCGYSWRPRGRDLSLRCPNCRATTIRVNYTELYVSCALIGLISILAFGVWLKRTSSQFSELQIADMTSTSLSVSVPLNATTTSLATPPKSLPPVDVEIWRLNNLGQSLTQSLTAEHQRFASERQIQQIMKYRPAYGFSAMDVIAFANVADRITPSPTVKNTALAGTPAKFSGRLMMLKRTGVTRNRIKAKVSNGRETILVEGDFTTDITLGNKVDVVGYIIKSNEHTPTVVPIALLKGESISAALKHVLEIQTTESKTDLAKIESWISEFNNQTLQIFH